MKKLYLIIVISFSLPIFAQHTQEKQRFEELRKTEQQIRNYVSKNLSSYKLSDKKIKEILDFNQETTNYEGVKNILNNVRKAELQKLYFKQHPEAKAFLNSFAPPAIVYPEAQTSLPQPENFSKSPEESRCGISVVPPTIINGISITDSFTGDVSTFPNDFTSCGTVTTPANSKYLGLFGAFTYTMNFSQPVNNLVINITGTGYLENEIFTFTTPAGNPSIFTTTSCYTTVIGNVIYSGFGSISGGGGGGIFTISAPSPFTSLTISGPGGYNGSLLSVCSSSVINEYCVPNLILTSPTNDVIAPNQDNRQASISITASNKINNNATGIYHAKQTVVLTNGFHSDSGSKFRGYIEDCSNTYVGKIAEEKDSKNITSDFQFNKNEIKVYPNPSDSKLTIETDGYLINKILIYSIDGKEIMLKRINLLNTTEVDISNFTNGVYLLKTETTEGKIFINRILKK